MCPNQGAVLDSATPLWGFLLVGAGGMGWDTNRIATYVSDAENFIHSMLCNDNRPCAKELSKAPKP